MGALLYAAVKANMVGLYSQVGMEVGLYIIGK